MDEGLLENREMRTVIRDLRFSWGIVISGVLQGSMLASVMCAIYKIDIVKGVNSCVSVC